MNERNWRWRTAKGEIVMVKDMDSQHIFNSIRMLFNNIAPEDLRISGGIKYSDIGLDKDDCYVAIREMIAELELREDSELQNFFSHLSEEQWKAIKAIKVYNEMKLI